MQRNNYQCKVSLSPRCMKNPFKNISEAVLKICPILAVRGAVCKGLLSSIACACQGSPLTRCCCTPRVLFWIWALCPERGELGEGWLKLFLLPLELGAEEPQWLPLYRPGLRTAQLLWAGQRMRTGQAPEQLLWSVSLVTRPFIDRPWLEMSESSSSSLRLTKPRKLKQQWIYLLLPRKSLHLRTALMYILNHFLV